MTTHAYNYPGETRGIYCVKHKKDGMINVVSKTCEFTNCITRPTFNYPEETRGIYCVKHKKDGMINVADKKCEHPGCMTAPIFNYPGEIGGIYCADHKKNKMVDVKNKKCEYHGCMTSPSHNYPGETRGIYCKEHKDDGMINVKSKTCEHSGCSILPVFNYLGEVGGLYCKEHKEDGMVDVKSKICKHSGCITRSIFNYPNESKAIYCVKHKKEGMIDVKNKKCEHIGCMIKSSYNYPTESKGIYCVEHKEENMIDVVNKICILSDCNKRANYNIFGQSPKYCTIHKPVGAILRPTPQCEIDGCNDLATHGIELRPVHCAYHSVKGEHDMFSKPCISCGLDSIIDEEGKCYYCNNANGLKYLHSKELKVKDSLDAYGLAYDQHDKVINCGKFGRERPDFLFRCKTHSLIVEVDENQHSDRPCQCEQIRMVNLSQSLCMPLVIIRYNPDPYKKDGETKRGEHENHNKRMAVLANIVDKYLKTPPEAFLTVTYLFFDGWNGIHQLSTILEFEGDDPKQMFKSDDETTHSDVVIKRKPRIIVKRKAGVS
jgi:hypothetical protein